MKTKNLIIIGVVCLVIWIAYYYYYSPNFGGLVTPPEKIPAKTDPETPSTAETPAETPKMYSMNLNAFLAYLGNVLKKYDIITTTEKVEYKLGMKSMGFLAYKYQTKILQALAQEGYVIKNVVLNDSTSSTGYRLKPNSIIFDNIQDFREAGSTTTEVQVKKHFASKGYDIWGVNYTKN